MSSLLTSQSFIDLLEVVADCTDRNDHTNAIATIAQYFDMKKYTKIFECIMKIQELEGSTPHQLGLYRSELSKVVLEYIKKTEGREVYEALHNCL